MKYLQLCIILVLLNACQKSVDSTSDRLVDDTQLISMGFSKWKYKDLLDSIGSWHNSYQEYLLYKIVESKVYLVDTINLKNLILRNSVDFFQCKGLKYSNAIDALKVGKPTNLNFEKTSIEFGNDAKLIINDLQKLVTNFDGTGETFNEKIIQLEARVLTLKNTTELISIGLPVYVAKHSYNFWDKNGSYWFSALAKNNMIQEGNNLLSPNSRQVEQKAAAGCDINLYKLGGADVSGAVAGAYSGMVLGPGGSLAGGVLGSATASLEI